MAPPTVNSERIAGLIGPTLMALAITESINLHHIVNSPAGVVYLSGAVLFVAGLAIVRAHNWWTTGWPVAVTLVGWLCLLAGLGRMMAPASLYSAQPAAYGVLAVLFVAGLFLTLKSRGARRHGSRKAVIVMTVLALALAAVAIMYGAGISREWKRISTGSRIAETACGPIEYASAGAGAPVLVIHGAGGGFDQGLELANGFAERGLAVIAVSRFGYLRTPLPDDASAEAQADAHRCLMDTLGIRRAAIMGVSAGAPSALQFAIRHPDRTAALFLLVPATYRPGDSPSQQSGAVGPSLITPPWTAFLFDTALRSDLLFWLAVHTIPDTMTNAILATPPELVHQADPAEQERFRRVMTGILPVSPRRLGLLNDGKVTSSLPRYDLESVRAPTLIVSAKDDRFGTYPAALYTTEHIAGARFIGYEKGGHLAVGHGEETQEAAASFFLENQ